MNLHNTTHTRSPVHDEASSVTLRTEDRRDRRAGGQRWVLLLPGAMLAHNAEPAVRAAWLNDMFLPPDAFDWALNVVVVRSGDRTILIDAGMGAEFPDLPRAGQ